MTKQKNIAHLKGGWLICLLTISTVLSGCSISKSSDAIKTTEERALSDSRPFSVKVEKDFFDGKRLYVIPVIESKERWSTSRVSLSLMAYLNGVVIGEKKVSLSEITPYLERGERREIPIYVEAKELTDYQVELLWGDESGVVRQLSGSQYLKITELKHGVKSKDCTDNNCQIVPFVELEVDNSSSFPLRDITLLVHSSPSQTTELALSERFPENTERIVLNAMQLAPGEKRVIRLILRELSIHKDVEPNFNVRIEVAEAEELAFEKVELPGNGRRFNPDQ